MQKTLLEKIKKLFSKKRVLIPTILILLIVGFKVIAGPNTDSISVVEPTVGDLSLTIQATGQVTSKTDLSLSFNKSGFVKSIPVSVGDVVKKGQVLATLSQGNELGALNQAKGALAAAQARLKKTLEGSSNEEIAIAQVNLDQTKLTQATQIKNAYNSLLNSTPEAGPYDDDGTNNYAAPTISGAYVLGKEGKIKVEVYSSVSGIAYNLSGLTTGGGVGNSVTPQPLGDTGLYIKFPEGLNNIKNWVITIPNKKAANYLANYNTYQNALVQAKSLISQREAELDLKKAQARGSDIELAKADILTAQGQFEVAQAKYEETIIRAPVGGTITKVDAKIGELADIQKKVIVLQDIGSLYIESDINESNIAKIKLSQQVSVNFDAFSDRKFTGQVVHVDPSSVTNDGVVNYKIKVSINEKDKSVRPGMNSEIVVLVENKSDVLAIPKAAITTIEGKSYVNLITNESKKKYKKHEVTTSSFIGDGNLIEITSGLSKTDKIALLPNK